jgi:hypothetical protein
VGIAISARSVDVRAAQQLGVLAGLSQLGVDDGCRHVAFAAEHPEKNAVQKQEEINRCRQR